MEFSQVIVTLLTSAGVSGGVLFLMRSYLIAKLKHHFERDLESYKAELAKQVSIDQELLSRRLEAYPELVDFVYRTRNMARDLKNEPALAVPSLFDEFCDRLRKLEDGLYRHRFDLERDGCFEPVHTYKGLLTNFRLILTDIEERMSREEGESTIARRSEDLRRAYREINDLHQRVIQQLSSAGTEQRG